MGLGAVGASRVHARDQRLTPGVRRSLFEEITMQRQPGCLSGLLKLFALNWLFSWLQRNFGFGRGASCSGIGCGIIMLIIFIALVCSVLTGTEWTRIGF
jgi:hypothetical protein